MPAPSLWDAVTRAGLQVGFCSWCRTMMLCNPCQLCPEMLTKNPKFTRACQVYLVLAKCFFGGWNLVTEPLQSTHNWRLVIYLSLTWSFWKPATLPSDLNSNLYLSTPSVTTGFLFLWRAGWRSLLCRHCCPPVLQHLLHHCAITSLCHHLTVPPPCQPAPPRGCIAPNQSQSVGAQRFLVGCAQPKQGVWDLGCSCGMLILWITE